MAGGRIQKSAMNVVISQSDLITPYGQGLSALWTGLLANQTAIKSTKMFAERNFCSDQAAIIEGLSVEKDQSRVMAMLRVILTPLQGKLGSTTPIILATTVGEIEYLQTAVLNNQPELAEESRPQHLLGKIKSLLDLRGPGIVLSSACASSAAALTHAASMIQTGEAKKVLVIAADAISEFVYSGFSTLQSLSPTPAAPFDANRCGLSLGEAAAWRFSNPIPLHPGQKSSAGATRRMPLT